MAQTTHKPLIRYKNRKFRFINFCPNLHRTIQIIEIEKNEDTTTEERDMIDMTNRILAIVVGLLMILCALLLLLCHNNPPVRAQHI